MLWDALKILSASLSSLPGQLGDLYMSVRLLFWALRFSRPRPPHPKIEVYN